MSHAHPARGPSNADGTPVEQLLSRAYDDPGLRRPMYEFFDHEASAWFHTAVPAVVSGFGIGLTLAGIFEDGAKLAGVYMLISAVLFIGPSAIKARQCASQLPHHLVRALAPRAVLYTLAAAVIGAFEAVLGTSSPNTTGLMILLVPLTALLAVAHTDRNRTGPMIRALDARGGA